MSIPKDSIRPNPGYPYCTELTKSDHISTKERLKQLDANITKHENKPATDDDDITIIYNEISFLYASLHKLIQIISEEE